MPIRPSECETVSQTPPDISWPEAGGGSYEIELVPEGGQVRRYRTPRNWLLIPEALPEGAYRWRVHSSRQGTRPGAWRTFTIAPGAVPFVVPEEDALIRSVLARARPRAFPRDAALRDLQKALSSSRAANWSAMLEEVARNLGTPVHDGRAAPANAAGERKDYSRALGENKRDASRVLDRMVKTAFTWKITGDRRYLDEARRLLAAAAAWDPKGATGVNHHQVAGHAVWSLALARDWLDAEIDAGEKRAVAAAVGARMEDLLEEFGIAQRRKLDKMPFNSHAWVALGEMAAASALMLGEHPQAERWFRATVRPFLFLYSPWGGHDGGFGNGMAYGIYDQLALTAPLDILHLATGVNPHAKGWSRNLAATLAYFMPPGSPTAVFGDAAEKLGFGSEVGDLANAIALRDPSPLSLWYRRQWPLQKPGSLIHVFAPAQSEAPAPVPPPLPPAAHFASTGWVAMHSSLADRARNSIYFRAGGVGSFSHNHADQNGFILNVRGRRLLLDSGYYDYRGSPHGNDWYVQTRAHNAITFDGGRGQAANDGAAIGEITAFEHARDFDIVTGDATAAYKGALSSAVRSLLYVRPNLLIVYDVLSAAEPRTWEWNAHALAPFRPVAADEVRVDAEDASLCLRLAEPGGFEFTQTNAFSTPPASRYGAGREVFPAQWHGRFRAIAPAPAPTS
jgi:hypothetical protein